MCREERVGRGEGELENRSCFVDWNGSHYPPSTPACACVCVVMVICFFLRLPMMSHIDILNVWESNTLVVVT